jgi:hypothetical protein
VKLGAVKTAATVIVGETYRGRTSKETPDMSKGSKTAEQVSEHVARQGADRKSMEKMPGSPSR